MYGNYGRPEDFEALEKMGVDVAGKVVLLRYGELFRGLKVRNAQKRGAKGILIYSDPADDGYAKGDVYPQGPYRPDSAIQRGSVQFLSIRPGDPSTPGWPSVKGAKRLPFDRSFGFLMGQEWEKATDLKRDDYFATIPSLPISYGAARPILDALGGPNVPHAWQGGLPLAYHVGPGPAEVDFSTVMDYRVRTIWNVIATLPGSVEPDRWVLVGNHRDAWVYGAVDPGSGTAATLEMCRALGRGGQARLETAADARLRELGRRGIRPGRLDRMGRGPRPGNRPEDGAPVERRFGRLGTRDRPRWCPLAPRLGARRRRRGHRRPLGKNPPSGMVCQAARAWAGQEPVDLPDLFSNGNGTSPDSAAARPAARFFPQMQPLGSGSDYTVFLDHLGVPAIDTGFSGRYGVYHSVYDNFTWMEKVGDPEFITHAMAARFYTVLAMRAAAAEVVPLKFVPYAEALRENIDDMRRRIERKGRAPSGNGEGRAQFEGLSGMVRAVRSFEDQAAALDRAGDDLARHDGVPREKLAKVNDALTRVERTFLLAGGLPARPWFNHAIYAPGVTTGYASWPLPGLRQAFKDKDVNLFAAAAVPPTASPTATPAPRRRRGGALVPVCPLPPY